MISGGGDCRIRVWNARTGDPLGIIGEHQPQIDAITISRDGHLAAILGHRTVRMWDLTHIGRQPLLRELDSPGGALVLTDKHIIMLAKNGQLHRVNLEFSKAAKKRLWVDPTVATAVTPDGRLGACVFLRKRVCVWNLQTGEEIKSTQEDNLWTQLLMFSPDSRFLIWDTGSPNNLKIWDLERGTEPRRLIAHTDFMRDLAFTPDGRNVISVSDDRTLRVWNLEDDALVGSFSGDRAFTSCACFNDGSGIAVGDAYGKIHLLRWMPQ